RVLSACHSEGSRGISSCCRNIERRLNFAQHDKSERVGQIVRGDLELMAVGIAEIDGVRDLVVLEFKFDSALFQFALRSEKIFPVRAKSEMKHSNFAAI